MATEETSSAPPGEPPVEFEFSDPEVLRMCLQMLNDEASKDEQRVAIDVLLKLCRNIMTHPGEEKYLKIRKENKAIHDKLLKFDGAREFLLATGWSEVDDLYMFVQDQDLSIAISILDEQLNMLPPPSTATSPPPSTATSPPPPTVSSSVQSPDGQTSVWSDEEIKNREKRLEEDRKKRMDEIKRIKREKEEIKKQIQEDRKDTNKRENQSSHAKPLNFGATFKKFENKGG